jgi:hypothetical protein
MNARYRRDSCLPQFKKLNILPLYSQYIFSLSTFVVKNTDALKSNSVVHSINTKQGPDVHLPVTNLTKAQKGYITPELKVSIIYH